MIHCIILEPDLACRQILENALASLHWAVGMADTPAEIVSMLPGPWAVLLAIESGDPVALETVCDTRRAGPDTVICALLDEHSPDFDRQLAEAGADSIFAKPVTETEIVEAVVAGFMRHRG